MRSNNDTGRDSGLAQAGRWGESNVLGCGQEASCMETIERVKDGREDLKDVLFAILPQLPLPQVFSENIQ
jgi:hypothetical protein